MAKSKHYYIRKSHRYLGVILGIQFLFWTLGGLYFSWTNLDEIHGDFHRKPVPRLTGSVRMISPDSVLKQVGHTVDSIHTVQMVTILQKPYWGIRYYSAGELRMVLADAGTGALRGQLKGRRLSEWIVLIIDVAMGFVHSCNTCYFWSISLCRGEQVSSKPFR